MTDQSYGFGPGPVGYGGYGSPADQAQRLAQAQLAEGSATTPIRSKWQGAARLANALMGGLGARQAMQGWQQGQQQGMGMFKGGASPGAAALGGAMTGGMPAAPGALADLQNATADTPNLTDADFAGLKDSDIMGQGPQMGPPMPAMAPNNMGGAPPPGAIPGGAMVGQNQMPPQGVQVASNDPNFMPSFPSPSADKGQAATFNPADLAMFQQDMQGAPGAVSQPPQGGGGGDLETLKANIAQTESGGNYGAQGPTTKSGDHAYGKYQVMGANVPSWTSAEGQSETPSQFLSDPDMQEKVASDRLGSAMSKYGAAGAAREWFTGSPTGKGSDVNGMTADKYAALATGGGGNSFLHSSVAGPGAPSAIGSPPPPQNDQQMFQQDQGSGAPQQDQQQQGGQPSGGVNLDAARAVIMNPYADPQTRQMAMQMLQSSMMPQVNWVEVPGTNNKIGLDRFGRPIPGMQIQGGPKNETVAPGSSVVQFDSSGKNPHTVAGWGAPGQGAPGGSQPSGAGGVSSQPQPGEDYNAYKARMEAQGKSQGQIANPGTEDFAKVTTGARGDESYKEADVSTNALNSMVQVAPFNSHATDKSLIDSYARIMNPGRAVGVGQYNINADIQSMPDEIKGDVMKAFNGSGVLSPQTRAAMLTDARIRVEAYQSSWKNARQGWLATAQHGNIDSSAVPDVIKPMDPDWGSLNRYSFDPQGNIIDSRNGSQVPHGQMQSMPGQPVPQPATPSPAAQAGNARGGQQMPTVSDQAGYDALPKGTPYIGPDGKQRVKS